MKNIIKSLLTGCVLTIFLATTARAEQRIAVVDIGKLVANYQEMVDGRASIKQSFDKLESDFKARLLAFEKLKQEHEKLRLSEFDQTVNEAERARRHAATGAKLEEVNATERSLQVLKLSSEETIQLQLKDLNEKSLKQIFAVVGATAKAGGYTLVLDRTFDYSFKTPNVIYSSGEGDLTEVVLATLNTPSPKPSSPSASDGSPKNQPAR